MARRRHPVSVHAVVAELETARRAVGAGAAVLRLAGGDTASLIAAGREFRALGTPFFVLDDLDAALELGADGVHLTARLDMGMAARRAGLRVGVSAEAQPGSQALAAATDYVDISAANPADLARFCAVVSLPVLASSRAAADHVAVFVAAGASAIVVRGAPRDRALRVSVERALAGRGRG